MQNLRKAVNEKDIKVAVLDYGMGNLFSVKQACEYAGLTPVTTSEVSEIMAADALILPGVGAFGDAMANLKKLDLISPVKEFIDSGKSFMGVCLGIQLLFTESEEHGQHKGFDIFSGSVKKFPSKNSEGKNVKVPQVGWNRINRAGSTEIIWEDSPVKRTEIGQFMYFVHSYYVIPEDQKIVCTETEYENITFCSTIVANNIFAVQYHPEKSADQGLRMYKNWAEIIKRKRSN